MGDYKMQYYRIYGKKITDSKYRAVDYHAGALVDKLIYATIIKESEKESALKMIDYMIKNNEGYHFELRAV
jgi:hypothetical protein